MTSPSKFLVIYFEYKKIKTNPLHKKKERTTDFFFLNIIFAICVVEKKEESWFTFSPPFLSQLDISIIKCHSQYKYRN